VCVCERERERDTEDSRLITRLLAVGRLTSLRGEEHGEARPTLYMHEHDGYGSAVVGRACNISGTPAAGNQSIGSHRTWAWSL
jgi:hypothetical protein